MEPTLLRSCATHPFAFLHSVSYSAHHTTGGVSPRASGGPEVVQSREGVTAANLRPITVPLLSNSNVALSEGAKKVSWLEREFEEAEVIEALHSVDGDKAPEPDWFNLKFLRSY